MLLLVLIFVALSLSCRVYLSPRNAALPYGLLGKRFGNRKDKTGFRVGRHAQMMPTLSSTDDQVAAPTLSYVTSVEREMT